MFSPPRKKLYDRIVSSAVNPVFYPLFVKSNSFTASDVCIGCGKCEPRCPYHLPIREKLKKCAQDMGE